MPSSSSPSPRRTSSSATSGLAVSERPSVSLGRGVGHNDVVEGAWVLPAKPLFEPGVYEVRGWRFVWSEDGELQVTVTFPGHVAGATINLSHAEVERLFDAEHY